MEDKAIRRDNFCFSRLVEIEKLQSNIRVDVIGIVLKVDRIEKLTTKDGRETDKVILTIGDDSKVSIEVGIWGGTDIAGLDYQVG